MSSIASRLILSIALAGLGLALGPVLSMPAAANPAHEVARGPSGLPLPRFVSLKASRVNLRVGPGLNYAVDWMYMKPGLPMEIIQEYDNWRRVRDADGTEGWINQSLLTGRRTAVVAPWQRGRETAVPMLAQARSDASVVAKLEPGVIGAIRVCNGEWCELEVSGHRGWVAQSQIWGAYPGEPVAR